jgi:hypothetical protein
MGQNQPRQLLDTPAKTHSFLISFDRSDREINIALLSMHFRVSLKRITAFNPIFPDFPGPERLAI